MKFICLYETEVGKTISEAENLKTWHFLSENEIESCSLMRIES